MALLCVDGHVSAGDFLDVMDYEDSLRLADVIARQEGKRIDAEQDQHAADMKAIMSGFKAVNGSIGNLQKQISRAFSK